MCTEAKHPQLTKTKPFLLSIGKIGFNNNVFQSIQFLSELEEMALYTAKGQTLVRHGVLRVCFSSLSCCALDFLTYMLSVLCYLVFPSAYVFSPPSTIFLPYCPCPYIPRHFNC